MCAAENMENLSRFHSAFPRTPVLVLFLGEAIAGTITQAKETILGNLLVVQLGDIHIRDEASPILAKANRIAEAAVSVEQDVEQIVIAVNGDLSFSGTSEQLSLGWRLLKEIGLSCQDQLNAPVEIAVLAVPGNHDCDFTADTSVRDSLVPGLLTKPEEPLGQAIADQCLIQQVEFFNSLQINSRIHWSNPIGSATWQLGYFHDIPLESASVRFYCLNSAFLSNRREIPAQLLVAPNALPRPESGAAVDVVVMHHPFGWLQPDNRLMVQRELESAGDILFTGHEHVENAHAISRLDCQTSLLHIQSGALLPGRSMKDSEFSVVVIDAAARSIKRGRFVWEESLQRYRSKSKVSTMTDPQGFIWETLPERHSAGSRPPRISKEFASWLDYPTIQVSHKSHDTVPLADIFVMPDFDLSPEPPRKHGEKITGDDFWKLVSQGGIYLISGEKESGRTSLAKQIYRRLHQEGKTPILLTGEDLVVSGDALLSNKIMPAFERQYYEPEREVFLHRPVADRVIIIDDLELLPKSVTDKTLTKAFDKLTTLASTVVILVDALYLSLRNLTGPASVLGTQLERRIMRIRPFRLSQIDELAHRWTNLYSPDAVALPDCDYHRHHLYQSAIDMLGIRLIPAFPLYLVTLFMSLDGTSKASQPIGTQGACYDILISASLHKGRNQGEFDKLLGFLSVLAKYMHENQRPTITLHEFRKVVAEHSRYIEVDLSPSELQGELIRCGVIRRQGEDIRFVHRYHYCYFFAYWLFRNISGDDARDCVRALATSPQQQMNRDLLLFTAYFSTDPVVVESLISAGEQFFSTRASATLTFEPLIFRKLRGSHPTTAEAPLTIPENTGDSQRKSVLAVTDMSGEQPTENDEWEDAVAESGNELIAAIGLIDVIGQMLRSYPSSLSGGRKFDLLECCIGLGLRIIGVIADAIDQVGEEVAVQLRDIVFSSGAKISEESATEFGQRMVVAGIEAMIVRVLVSVAAALGSPYVDQVFERWIKDGGTPVSELLRATRMLCTSKQISFQQLSDAQGSLGSYPFALGILRLVVVYNVVMVRTGMNYKEREKLARLFGFNLSMLEALPALPPGKATA